MRRATLAVVLLVLAMHGGALLGQEHDKQLAVAVDLYSGDRDPEGLAELIKARCKQIGAFSESIDVILGYSLLLRDAGVQIDPSVLELPKQGRMGGVTIFQDRHVDERVWRLIDSQGRMIEYQSADGPATAEQLELSDDDVRVFATTKNAVRELHVAGAAEAPEYVVVFAGGRVVCISSWTGAVSVLPLAFPSGPAAVAADTESLMDELYRSEIMSPRR